MKIDMRLRLFSMHAEEMARQASMAMRTPPDGEVEGGEAVSLVQLAGRFMSSLQEDGEFGNLVSSLKDGKPENGDRASCLGALLILANAPPEALAELKTEHQNSIAEALAELLLNEETADLQEISMKAIVNMFGPDGLTVLVVDGDFPELRDAGTVVVPEPEPEPEEAPEAEEDGTAPEGLRTATEAVEAAE